MRWGEAGPGQWITVFTNPGHAYVVIAGLRFDTSGPGERGPRWRKSARVERRVHGAPPRGLLASSAGASSRAGRASARRRPPRRRPSARRAALARCRRLTGVPVDTMSPGSSVIRPREVGDQRRHGEDQVLGAGRLHRLSVQRQRDPDAVVRSRLVGRHERRPARSRLVEDLARHPLRRGELEVARRQVVEQRVAGDVVERVRPRRRPGSGARSRTRPRPRSRPSRWRTAASPARHAARGRCGTWRRRWGRPAGRCRPRPRACGSSGRCRRSCPDPAPAAASWTSSSGTPSPWTSVASRSTNPRPSNSRTLWGAPPGSNDVPGVDHLAVAQDAGPHAALGAVGDDLHARQPSRLVSISDGDSAISVWTHAARGSALWARSFRHGRRGGEPAWAAPLFPPAFLCLGDTSRDEHWGSDRGRRGDRAGARHPCQRDHRYPAGA